MQLFKVPVERFEKRPIFLDKLQWWGSRPASVQTKRIAVRLGQTDRGQVSDIFYTQIFSDLNSCDVIDNVLAVVHSSCDIVVRVDRDGLNIKYNVELLATLLGCEVPAGLELPADDLRILPRHDLNTGVDPALRIIQTQDALNIVATAVGYCVASLSFGHCVASLSFTEKHAVSCCHYDERARGARQDGGSTVVGLVLSASEGADPGISPPAILEYWLGC